MTKFFTVVEPRRGYRGASRMVAVFNWKRRWFRYEVVESTRPVVFNGVEVSPYTHVVHSLHWTRRAARATANDEARKEQKRLARMAS